jgi:CO/xanthine dehydrogenase Mo-binding subunit
MKKRGKGIGCMYFGIGNSGRPNPSSAFVDVLDDGSALVICGAADMGQGTNTALAQIAAEELGLRTEEVNIRWGDTMSTPDAGASSASRQTYVSGNAVRMAAAQAKQNVLAEAALMLDTDSTDLEMMDGVITDKKSGRQISFREAVKSMRGKGILAVGTGYFNPPATAIDEETGRGIPFATYHYCTQVAEVEVDTETGEVDIISVVAAHDLGKAINPLAAEGQIDGGIAMGIGFTLMEEVVLENGMVKTPTFAEYMIPTTMDVTAEIEPIIVEAAEPTGPFGAKGTAEPPTCPTGAAIANAIYDAVGIRIKEFPITPARLYNELVKAGQQG